MTSRTRSRIAWTVAVGSVLGLFAAELLKLAFDLDLSEDLLLFFPVVVGAITMNYFCVLEALNNVAMYAHANAATETLVASNGDLRFMVSDDGLGFDPSATGSGTWLRGLSDRLEAVGGPLEIRSEPGAGTTVAGAIDVGERR